jgi:hypothetical protein
MEADGFPVLLDGGSGERYEHAIKGLLNHVISVFTVAIMRH